MRGRPWGERMTGVTAMMAEHFCALDLERVRAHVIHRAKRLSLDRFACLIAATKTKIAPIVLEALAGLQAAEEQGPIDA
jgi:hypothetical protein